MACSRRVWSVGSFALWKSSSYVDLLSQYTARSARSWIRYSFLVSEERQKCQTVWQYVRWGNTANVTICNSADVEMRLRDLRRTPVWEKAFVETLLTWLKNDSWSSRVTPKSVISVVNHDKCKSLWQFLGPRLITWYLEKLPCERLLLYQSEMSFPSSVKMLFASLVVFATENSWRISNCLLFLADPNFVFLICEIWSHQGEWVVREAVCFQFVGQY